MYSCIGSLRGPTFRQRLLGFARSSVVITVVAENRTFRGRVISVDIDNFEMVLTAASGTIRAGSIVNVGFRELVAIAIP